MCIRDWVCVCVCVVDGYNIHRRFIWYIFFVTIDCTQEIVLGKENCQFLMTPPEHLKKLV